MSIAMQGFESADLLAQIGARVRLLRKAKGLSRQSLAERSGVSPRYLAQIESGASNISVGLLHRVAMALGCAIEQLLKDTDAEVAQIAELATRASPEQRDAARRLLSCAGKNRVCLVGLRGAGKSTLGHLAGKALGVPFIELNREIENLGSMPVAEIMALYGQDGYRRLEADALTQIAALPGPVILAVAGGIVSDSATYAQLREAFHTVWVKASPQEHMDRVRAQGDLRPMKGNPQALGQLKAILAEREPHYAQAENCLDTSGEDREKSLERLVDLIRAQRFLTP